MRKAVLLDLPCTVQRPASESTKGFLKIIIRVLKQN